MKLSVKSLLFDYGGTIDTNGVHWGEVIREAYVESKIPVSNEQFREAYIQVERMLGSQPFIHPNHTFRDVLELKIRLQFETLGLADFILAGEIALSCYEKTAFHIRRASLVLDQLKERYPMYLVSNFYGNLRTVLCEFNLTGYFREVIESAETGYRKPGLEIFQIAIEKTGCLPGEVVIIGDSYKNDIQPAERLGCPSIWLKVKGWHDGEESIQHPLIIEDFSELTDIL